jgi:hypothetical protein
MANTLSVSGNTRLAWVLSENQNVGSVSKSVEQRSSRSITNGTGPNQANVAMTATVSVTGTNTQYVDLAEYYDTTFGYQGILDFTVLNELVVNVTTGPTGGNLTVGTVTITDAPTGVRMNVGSQMHIASYITGYPVQNSFSGLTLQSNVTGTYSVRLTAVGVGDFRNIY